MQNASKTKLDGARNVLEPLGAFQFVTSTMAGADSQIARMAFDGSEINASVLQRYHSGGGDLNFECFEQFLCAALALDSSYCQVVCFLHQCLSLSFQVQSLEALSTC